MGFVIFDYLLQASKSNSVYQHETCYEPMQLFYYLLRYLLSPENHIFNHNVESSMTGACKAVPLILECREKSHRKKVTEKKSQKKSHRFG